MGLEFTYSERHAPPEAVIASSKAALVFQETEAQSCARRA